MAAPVEKRKKLWRRIWIGILFLVISLGVVYWIIANEKFADTKDRTSAYSVNALEFIHEFEQDYSAANKKYSDKIITVNGRVAEVEAADTTVNIKFIDTLSGSYAIFAFQEQHAAEAKTIKAGDSVSIKGSFSSGFFSEILGTTAITFKRSTLNK